jgi:hypothetical protein
MRHAGDDSGPMAIKPASAAIEGRMAVIGEPKENHLYMSAFGGRADVANERRHVRF